MLISNIFSRKVYPFTVIGLVILEIIFLTVISICFHVSLKYNTEYLDTSIFENIREIQKSFNSFLTRRISSAKQDLFLIGKYSDIFLGKLNMKIQYDENNQSCLINGLHIQNSSVAVEYNNVSDKENPMISFVSDYLKNNNFNSEKMIKDFKKNKLLDHISFLGDESINKYESYICYMKTIFKSLFIKETVSKGKYMSFNNIHLFIDDFVFQFLPQETTIKALRKLSIYSKKINCEFKYTSNCISTFIKENINYSINEKFKNISQVVYFHYFDTKYNFFSCLDLNFTLNWNKEEAKTNFVCTEHNMKYLFQTQFSFQNLSTMEIKNNFTDLINVINQDGKLMLIYSLANDHNEFFNIYNTFFINYNEPLKDYIFSEESLDIQLFHLIYFKLFKYKQSEITSTLIQELIDEYETIKRSIIKEMEEIKNNIATTNYIGNFDKTLNVSQHFLHSTYNKSGLIDYENGKIKKGDFVYLISPLIDRNVYYLSNKYTKINFSNYDNNYSDVEANVLGFNIILYQNSFNIWNLDIFILMILIILKWCIYFLILIVFLITLINALFTKVLDKIFQPISLLYERLNTKIMSTKLIYTDIKAGSKPNHSNENDKNEENSTSAEIVSLTPEMEELIQLCKFLENISYMKELMLSNEQMEFDFNLMNEMYNVLSNRIDMIKYGHFVSSFYFKKKKYIECNNSIKVIENILENEEDKFKEENENIEIEVINAISNKYYINEFQSSREVFENKTSLSQLNYYELIIIREKLYFYLGICNLYQIVELKKKVKDLKKDYELQNKKNYYNNLRGRALTNRRIQTKSNSNSKRYDNSFGRETFQMKLNSQVKAMEILENQIIKKTEIAIKYFKLSYEINNKYCINKIKCIIILLYIAKCQLYKEKNKSDAIDTMKNAIIKLYTLNQEFIKINEICQFNPIIMLLVNGAIMEQILYLIAKINNKTNNKLVIELLSDIMKLSYFKTDNIQSKSAKNITYLIKKANSNLKNMNKKINSNLKRYSNKISFFEKMSFRLDPEIIILQNNNPNIVKNIFILFSPNLIKVLPSSIELSEILSKCARNYMSPNDRIQCLRFDMSYNPDNFKTPSELNKDFITRILQENEIKKNDKYGMQNCIFSIVHKFSKMNFKKSDDILDKDIIFNDNYIFQFILSKDYIFDIPNNNKKFKDELKNNNISLYTFVFDEELKTNNSKENNRINEIIKNIKKIPEGVLIFVDNFVNIKMVFQNISRKYKPKNIFRINSKAYNNIYIDYH